MAKVLREKSQRKPKVDGSGEGEGNPAADFLSLPAEEREAIKARLHESMALESRLAPYDMLEGNEAHERELAKNVQKAAKEAERLAGRLNKLSEFLGKIDKQRRGGPLARWLWGSSPEGRLGAYSPTPPTNPPPWEQKPKGGMAVVAEIVAKAFEKVVAGTLGEEAARSRARKGGRPRAVLFSAACRLLYNEGRSDREIAEMLLTADVTKGALAEVQERVRVLLNRFVKNPERPIHEHVDAVEKVAELERISRSRWAEGGMPIGTLVGSRDPTKPRLG